uniref:Uncharacterized protein n=1 Tax=Anguilla anguilla TaxID=7936 RepID=A0A0E9SY67_ANGAN
MINGLHLYSAFYPKRFTIDASHSPIHTCTHTPTAKGCHARYHKGRTDAGYGVWVNIGLPPQPSHPEKRPWKCVAIWLEVLECYLNC